MARDLKWNTRAVCSARSNACTRPASFPGKAPAWLRYSALSIATAAAYGRRQRSTRAQVFTSHCRNMQSTEQIGEPLEAAAGASSLLAERLVLGEPGAGVTLASRPEKSPAGARPAGAEHAGPIQAGPP